MHKRKKQYVIAIALGLLVTVVSYFYLQAELKGEEKIGILVPKSDILPYTVIKTSSLEQKWLPKGSETPHMVRSDQQVAIVGKIATTMLPQGVPVDMRQLKTNDDALTDKHIVAISTDYVRSAAAEPGDLADVYFVNTEQQPWIPTAGSQLVTENAIVLSVTARNGQTLNSGGTSAIPIGTPPSAQLEPGAVRLAVNPQDAAKLVAGALPDNTHYVLVVKSQETITLKQLASQEQEGEDLEKFASEDDPPASD